MIANNHIYPTFVPQHLYLISITLDTRKTLNNKIKLFVGCNLKPNHANHCSVCTILKHWSVKLFRKTVL